MPGLKTLQRACVAAAVGLLCGAGALAQSSPYYVGVAQSLDHDSNLFRIGGGVSLPANAQSKSDTLSTTSLVAGVDQTWGRQRLTGSGSLRATRFSSNDHLNNEGYGFNLGLDWATIERVSGRLAVSSDRSLRGYDPAYNGGVATKNIEDNNLLSGTVRVGVVTRLTAEASASRRHVRFSSPAYASAEYDQTTGSLGLRYRLGGATTAGLAWRQSSVKPVLGADPFKRRDIDLTANWVPSGLSTVYARLSHSSTDHSRLPARDFSGFTGELLANTQATGKIKLGARVARELGQSSYDFVGLDALLRPQRLTEEFNRVGTSLRFTADYELSAKIAINASVDHVRRNFDGTQFASAGDDRTTSLALGARWLPTRAIQVGCNVSHAKRSVNNVGLAPVGNNFASTGFGCSGQFIFQ